MKLFLTLLAILLLSQCGCTKIKYFYVSPQGKDINPGTSEQPFATLEKARDAARGLDKKIPRKIILQDGEYYLNQTLELNSRDDGLTIEAMSAGRALIYGGQRINNWTKENDRFYFAALPDVKAGNWDFRTLVVDGRLCHRACLPENGTFKHKSKFDVRWTTTSAGGWERKPTEEELTTLKYDPNDIPPNIDVNNAEITVYHLWDESLVGVKSISPETDTFIFSNTSGHPAGGFGVDKYVIWNIKEGMTRPGQWYLDRTNGKIVYWPLPDEDIDNIKAIAPKMETIIKIRGSKAGPAKDITIKDVAFSVTNTPLKSGGFGAGLFKGAVELAYCQGCSLIGLEIFNVAGHGVSGSCSEGVIQGCHVYNTGACGIKFGGFAAKVVNNHIHNNGVLYPSGIALWCFGVAATHEATPESNPMDEIDPDVFGLIAHNEIHDTPYTGIAGYGHNLIIESNRVYKPLQVLRDGAGIYITYCTNIKLCGNFVRDVPYFYGKKCFAYYVDELAKEILIEGNLALRCPAAFYANWNHGNILRNNVFVTEDDAYLLFRGLTVGNYTVEKNIVSTNGTIHIENPDAASCFKDNILYSAKGMVKVHGRTENYLSKQKNKNVFKDPELLGFEKGHVRFRPDSPAYKLCIKPIDVSNAGCLTSCCK